MENSKVDKLQLGSKAVGFVLEDVVTGKKVSLDDLKSHKALLVIFMCNHCPYVRHVEKEISKISEDYKDKDIGMVAISSNDPDAYPEDSPEGMKEQAHRLNLDIPYLFDEKQAVAKAYKAYCTPDFYLFDDQRELVYHGQLDDSRPGNERATDGSDLRSAIENVLSGNEPDTEQRPSTGCSIKWKPGNEPEYIG